MTQRLVRGIGRFSRVPVLGGGARPQIHEHRRNVASTSVLLPAVPRGCESIEMNFSKARIDYISVAGQNSPREDDRLDTGQTSNHEWRYSAVSCTCFRFGR